MRFYLPPLAFVLLPCLWCLINFWISLSHAAASKCTIPEISDQKDLKRLIKSRSSILALFLSDNIHLNKVTSSFLCEGIEVMKGQVGVGFVNCGGNAKRLCKQWKVNPSTYILQHYSNGEYNKNYDRQSNAKSLVRFLKDPKGEIPWSEDLSASSVKHIEDVPTFVKTVSKEKRPVFVMFFAPWCGHCKRLKPHYAEAAGIMSKKVILAAMDVNDDQFNGIRSEYNISGFPTLIYFSKGKPQFLYQGQYTSQAIVDWLNDPKPFEKKSDETNDEADWSTVATANDIAFLSDDTFDDFVKSHSSVFLMVYAPWCGHCKRMKPEFEEAATELKSKHPGAVLAALDATVNRVVTEKLGVKGFPTIKYLENGAEPYMVNYRTKEKIVEFMLHPKEPPPEPIELPWEKEPSQVLHLTDETFASSLKKKKFAIVIFFAPWCGHCKRAKPEFTGAAEQMRDQVKVALAAVDCTKYEDLCVKYSVSGYPTIKVFNYGKNPYDYVGGRTEDSFVGYLKELLDGKHVHNEL